MFLWDRRLEAERWGASILHVTELCSKMAVSVGVLASNAGVRVPHVLSVSHCTWKRGCIVKVLRLVAKFWFSFCFSLTTFDGSGDHFVKRVKGEGKEKAVDRLTTNPVGTRERLYSGEIWERSEGPVVASVHTPPHLRSQGKGTLITLLAVA